ncbi:metal-binding protein, partial [Patescibacteria group bacterium]|nr:metal-binding protein [Patescibacteria group bacterium]
PPVSNIFFASNRGNKYYPLSCSAGKTIKQENRVFFDSASAAESAGYTLSSSCSK